MARLMWPIRASIVDSETPFSASLVAKVCLRSWSRQRTPVSFLSSSQPQVISVACRVGSEGTGLPHGKEVLICLRLAKLLQQTTYGERRESDAKSSLMGIMRPVPFEVFARPRERLVHQIRPAPKSSDNASPDLMPVNNSRGISVPRWGVRRFFRPSRMPSARHQTERRPTSFRSSSFRTFGQSRDHG